MTPPSSDLLRQFNPDQWHFFPNTQMLSQLPSICQRLVLFCDTDLKYKICKLKKTPISFFVLAFPSERTKAQKNSSSFICERCFNQKDQYFPIYSLFLQKHTDKSIMPSAHRLLPLPWSSPRPVGWRTWPSRSRAAWAACLCQELCSNPEKQWQKLKTNKK